MLNFKKIASVMATAAMIGTTFAFAHAASYPDPFRSAGSAAIVYGSNAAVDLAGAIDISTNLQAHLGSGDDEDDDEQMIDGEAFPLFTSSTEIYLNSSINTARTSLTEDDMPSLLADGDFSGNVDAEYTQTIVFPGNSRVLFGQEPTSDDDPTVFVNLGTSSSSVVYNATITFDQAIALNHSDSEGESLDLFGTQWTVGADTTGTSLVLYKSSERISLSLGGSSPMPSTTVEVDGESYTIELLAASDTEATLRVTDEAGESRTKEINEDDSSKVNNIEIAVAYSDESDATGIVSAEIIVGSQKITLVDGQNVQVGSEEDSLDGTQVDLVGTNVGALTGIVIQTYSQDSDEDALVTGGMFMDPVWGTFDLRFTEMNIPLDSENRDIIDVEASGDDRMRITMTNHQGKEQTFEWVNNESQTARLAYGDRGNEVIKVQERAALNRSMYVTVGNQDEGYLLKLRTVQNVSDGTDDDITFENVFDNSQTYKVSVTSEGVGTLSVGGKTYTVTYAGSSTTSDSVVVRLNYPDSSGDSVIVYPTIETDKGAKVAFYEPLNITLGDYDGAGTDVSSLLFPDGDDYASASTVVLTGGLGSTNFTVGGGLVNGTSHSTTVTIGRLSYNFTYAGNNATQVFLIDPVNGGNIVKPAIVIFEEEEDGTDNEEALVVTLTGAGTSNSELEVDTVVSTRTTPSSTTGTGNSFVSLESNDDLSQILTLYGTLVTKDSPSSGQTSATISYPDDQVQAMLYVAEGDASISSGSGSTTNLGVVTVKDSEVETVSSRNMVIIGGSCVNMVAAALLGSDSPLCGSSFTAETGVSSGQFLIESFNSPYSSGKVAVLVAGYDASDTQNAAKFLTTQTVDTTVGKKYRGTSATSAELVTDSE